MSTNDQPTLGAGPVFRFTGKVLESHFTTLADGRVVRVLDRVELEPEADRVYCDLRGVDVPMSECLNSCAAPEHRPVCWDGHLWRADEPAEG